MYDVVIAGGGVVGVTMALALAHDELSVAVIEQRPALAQNATSGRVSALNCAARALLTRLGVWQRLPLAHIGIFRRMAVWDARSGANIAFDANDIGLSALGYVVDNNVLLAALEEQLAQHRVHTYRGTGVHRQTSFDDRIEVDMDDHKRLTAALLIGADGARSRVRSWAAIATRSRDYAQSAVVAKLHFDGDHLDTAWQHFLPNGPIALLPLADEKACSLVWSTTAKHADCLLKLSEADFCAAVTQASEQRVGTAVMATSRDSFPLHQMLAERYLDERVVLIGDAAHVIHPLAGQGLNQGLLDVAALAQVIQGAAKRQRNIATNDTLRRYERWRQGQNVAVAQLMSAFNTIFCSASPVLHQVRRLGFGLVHNNPLLRRFCASLASGQIGDIPPLSRLAGVTDVWHDGIGVTGTSKNRVMRGFSRCPSEKSYG